MDTWNNMNEPQTYCVVDQKKPDAEGFYLKINMKSPNMNN